VAGTSSTEPEHQSPLAVFENLSGSERLAALGAVVCAGSLVLPWYRVTVAEGLVKTGLGAFGFAEAALLLTVVAALVLLWEVGQGHRPSLPVRIGTLLTVAGIWCVLLTVYLMFDRPHLTVTGLRSGYQLAYGIFVATGGGAVMVIAGLRERRSPTITRPVRE
jgi:hypothetical protein